jgi:hypothetical protein
MITASAVQGKGGTYELRSVTGIEPGFRLGWTIAAIAGVLVFFFVEISLPKNGAGDWFFYTAMLLCGGMIWGNASYRPVFVRTATGLAPLTSFKSSGARQKIAAAFLAAKQAASG